MPSDGAKGVNGMRRDHLTKGGTHEVGGCLRSFRATEEVNGSWEEP